MLWVVTTQWRAQATGYAGDPNARTPALDALASQSINYTQAVTPHPFGPFARAAMLTGIPSPQNGVGDYFDPLPVDSHTIAHAMRDRGYDTAWFGKWHLWKRDPSAPLVGEAHAKIIVPEEARGGFAFWEGFESGFLLNDPWLHGSRLPEPTRFSAYQSDILCERAAAWIESGVDRSSPWFCVVSLEAPHPPYDAPAAGIEPRSPADITLASNVPRGGEAEAKVRRELAGYHAHIEATDRAIGRLLARVPEDTVVIFTSVHGDMHGAHGLFRKGWPHEESVRVPMLVRLRIADCGLRSGESIVTRMTDEKFRDPRSALRNREPVSLIDLPAMTCALADGREWRSPCDHAEISMPSVVALPYQCDRIWGGIRTPERKQIYHADGTPWLDFDLANDPHEQVNRIG